jgi:hypothetical protein
LAVAPGGPFSASNSNGLLGQLDTTTGAVTAIVTGFANPRGMAFIPEE